MTIQYDRRVSLVVGDANGKALDFTEFRCVFTVRRGDFQTPNSLDARIYNLADQTANLIQNEFTQIALSAGYAQGNFGLIFRGDIKQKRRGRVNQLDTYVDITAADGDQAYNFSPMALSLSAGSKAADDIQAYIKSMTGSISQGYIPELPETGRVRGKVFFGQVRDELRDFAETNNVLWSIQDGQLTLIPKTAYIPGEAVVISPQTGMLGVPEITQNGLRVRVLLNPLIKIGQLIQLDSTDVNRFRYGLDAPSQADNLRLALLTKSQADGLYYVMSMDHYGDTRGRGDDFYSEMTCLAVDATIPPNPEQAVILPAAAIIAQN